MSGKNQNENTESKKRIRVGRVTLFKVPGSPNWYMDYSIDGKQYRPSTKTRSVKQATILAEKKNAELVLGHAKPPERSKLKLSVVTENYLQHLARAKRLEATLANYRGYFRQFVLFAQAKGVMRLDRVTAELLEDFQTQLGIDGLKQHVRTREEGERKPTKNGPRTIRDKLKLIRQLIKWAIRRRLLHDDPGPGYKLPPEPQLEAVCWTREELQAILNNASDRFADVFRFFSLTGLRSSELCWLTKDDVCLTERPHILIRPKTCPITGVKWSPKKRKERIVPLCSRAADIASRAMSKSTGPWLFWGGKTKGSPTGRFTPQQLRAGLKAAMKAGKVKKGVVHTFRHVFCSYMANNNVPPLKVMKILGHGNLEIMLIYYHLSTDELLSSLDEVDFTRLVPNGGKEVA